MTKREYLEMKAILWGVHFMLAKEAVASTALEHPEWDMDEVKTWDEWESENKTWGS